MDDFPWQYAVVQFFTEDLVDLVDLVDSFEGDQSQTLVLARLACLPRGLPMSCICLTDGEPQAGCPEGSGLDRQPQP